MIRYIHIRRDKGNVRSGAVTFAYEKSIDGYRVGVAWCRWKDVFCKKTGRDLSSSRMKEYRGDLETCLRAVSDEMRPGEYDGIRWCGDWWMGIDMSNNDISSECFENDIPSEYQAQDIPSIVYITLNPDGTVLNTTGVDIPAGTLVCIVHVSKA
jgi:hypothetical protein